jgi:hypothetical protein
MSPFLYYVKKARVFVCTFLLLKIKLKRSLLVYRAVNGYVTQTLQGLGGGNANPKS